MGYKTALEAAGASVREFKKFGSYQGDWFAILNNGNVVSGSYGSCSGCDAFEAEFGWSEEEAPDYQDRLASFGRQYLASQESIDEITSRYEIRCSEDYAWEDDKEILEWLKSLVNGN